MPYSCTEPGDTWPHRTQASAGRYLRSRMASPSVMISSGVSVVNIDNGFGAGYLASMINHMEGKK